MVTFLLLAEKVRAWSWASPATLCGPAEAQRRAVFGQLPACVTMLHFWHRHGGCQAPAMKSIQSTYHTAWGRCFSLGGRYCAQSFSGCQNTNNSPPVVVSLLRFSLSVSLIMFLSLPPPLPLHSLSHCYL